MTNSDVIDLFGRVKTGTVVVVLPPNGTASIRSMVPPRRG